MQSSTERRAETDQPIYWFAVLELAIARADLEAAASAIGELRRLGIEVRYNLRGAGRA
jgi:hypothetical protein